MRYQTEAVGETTWLLGELPSGGAVTVTLYKLSDSSTPALDSNACTEIGATGIYKWATTNITTPETTKTEYLYVMTDGTLNYFGKIVVGGYVDKIDEKSSDIKSQTDKMNFTGTDIKATLDGEKVVLSDATEGQIDDIETDLNTPDQYKADVSGIPDAVWDEILTGATHNIATSAGKRLRQIGAYAIHDGTAQAGTITTITLAATLDIGDGTFNRNLIVIVDGTGEGQTRSIADYDNTTKVCVIDRDWRITPDNTSEYQILAQDGSAIMDYGIARGGTATTITLRAYASSVDDIYLCNMIGIVGGTGRGQSRLVGSYNGTTRVVTVCGWDWEVIPDTTSVYMLFPYGTTCTSCLNANALAQINAECDTALADYSPALEATLTAIKGAGWTDETLKAIKEYIDELESGEKPIPVPKSIGEAEENKL